MKKQLFCIAVYFFGQILGSDSGDDLLERFVRNKEKYKLFLTCLKVDDKLFARLREFNFPVSPGKAQHVGFFENSWFDQDLQERLLKDEFLSPVMDDIIEEFSHMNDSRDSRVFDCRRWCDYKPESFAVYNLNTLQVLVKEMEKYTK